MVKAISEKKRRDIRDAIAVGMKLTDIRMLLNTSAGTITKVKREMGLPIRPMNRTRTRRPVETVARVVPPPVPSVMHHREIPRSLGMATAPTTVARAYTPQEYFEAIAEGLRSRDAENDALEDMRKALRDEVSALHRTVAWLEADNLRLLADLNQCKHQMANWSGPASLPNRSLGNGG
jgi:methionine synthase II (cobalamin-independent)